MTPPHRRRGTAIIAALAIVLLGGALLASAASVSTASARAALGERAALAAEGEVRRALASTLSAWPAAADSLAVGAFLDPVIAPESPIDVPVRARVRVHRLDAALFALTADAVAGRDGAPPLARRRVRLVVRRPAAMDTTLPPAAPVPISRWSMADLY